MASLAKTSRPVARLIGRHSAVQAMLDSPATLTWIAAPAGSGKTSLGLEFCQAAGPTVAWLRLDEADIDPASFLLYFEQAIANGGVAPGWQPPPLLREHLPALHGYLRLYVRALGAALAPASRIVLDDAHRCQDAPFFRQFLDTLATELPPASKVVVLSRALPPAACARLLAHGDMHELDGAALAFSRDETEILLNVLGIVHADSVADSVYNFTRGWAAGIALVASWLKRRPGAALAAEDVLSEAMVGYLAEEVFSAYSDEERATLLAVCWLPHFSGAWAAALSGAPHAADIVARLAAQGALIYEYPGRQYALHPLFQGFLRKWAATHIDDAQRRAWIAGCIDTLLADGSGDTAIKLALEHGMPERAAGLIESRAEAMLASARHTTLARWIDALPEAQRSPWHHYWLGLAVFMSDTARARAALLKALQAFTEQNRPMHRFLALSAIISSYFFDGAAEQPLRAFLQQHVDPSEDYDQLPDPDLKAHLTHSMWSGLFMTDPGHQDMDLWEQRALDVLRQPADPTLKVRLGAMLGQHYYQSGRYAAVRSVRVLLDALPEAAALPPYARYLSHLVQLYDALAAMDHARFDAVFTACRASSESSGIRIMDAHYVLLYAAACLLRGELDKAATATAEVAAQTPPQHHNLVAHLQLTQTWLASCRGDGHGALAYARLAHEAALRFGSVPYEIYAQAASCVAWTLLDRDRCAAETVVLRQHGRDYNSPLAATLADLLEAWLFITGADGKAQALPQLQRAHPAQLLLAQDKLRRALNHIASQGGGYLTFATPHILQPLCAHALAAGIIPGAANMLVRAWRLAPPEDAGDNWPWPVQVRSFGGFELRIAGEPLRSQGKSKHRQLDILKLIAAHAPSSISLERAAELLWPDADGDTARHALETTLSRLRATLGAGCILLEQGTLSLAPQQCWSDTAALERLLPRLQTLTQEWATTGDAAPASHEAALLTTAAQVLSLYRGELLHGESAPWLLARRELWRGKLARALGDAGRQLAHAGNSGAATQLLERALEADQYCKTLSANLMRIHLDGAAFEAGLSVYRRYQRMALSALGAPVAPEIEALAQQLLAGAAQSGPAHFAGKAGPTQTT
ncbi:BTAD domain-containing putative transcriptional regulator [Duganella violaceipulchra]|uniref:Transcriptional regulator n=1 Tax=Duganella violaceipulchra TaxID=2849652 RepID=A0AA41H590_9BURK|nr:BTAD domain-containing putative transcriptional regulator [Duganella violaceicalia]MBV6320295.1 transcriptional regulator [Duganella violaceicalia]MCP2011744.1 ATP/maltotriose-dependent transcriptional regulator MalT/DNA-binding SARP family transcriptional activator [Duganella violaceicalia]